MNQNNNQGIQPQQPVQPQPMMPQQPVQQPVQSQPMMPQQPVQQPVQPQPMMPQQPIQQPVQSQPMMPQQPVQQPVQPRPNNVPPMGPNNNNYGQQNMNNLPNKKNNSTSILIGILLVVVVVIIIAVSTGKGKSNKQDNKGSSNTTSQINSNTSNITSKSNSTVSNNNSSKINADKDNYAFDSTTKKIYTNNYETGSSISTGLIVINVSDNGEANLVSNLTNLYGEKKSLDQVKTCASEKYKGIELFVNSYKLKNSGREYNITYSCDFRNGIKTLIMNDTVADGAIIVVSAKKGITENYSVLLSTLNKIGISKVIVYVNNDDNSKQSSVVNSIKSLITNYGYDKNTPVIVGKNDTNSTKQFMTELEKWIGKPKAASEKPFLMSVEDVFTIKGRGTVATGRVETGSIKVNEKVEIVGIKDTKTASITGIEMFRKNLDSATAGDNTGLLLKDLEREDIERGQVLAKPGTISSHTKFKALYYTYTQDENGRHTPFFTQYRPQFYFRTTDITGYAELPQDVEVVFPGSIGEFNVTLATPCAMNRGDNFAMREGGRTVGYGRVIELLD